jgi:Cu(I)/Ag(I) efflux system protein CusF
MKALIAAVALALSFAVQAQATHEAAGVVKKVDREGGRITLAHEPVKSLNWPAMTMVFRVQDRKLLDKVAPEAKVQFEFVQQGSSAVITRIK